MHNLCEASKFFRIFSELYIVTAYAFTPYSIYDDVDVSVCDEANFQ